MAMKDTNTGGQVETPASPSRRRLLAGAAVAGGVLLTQGRVSAAPQPVTAAGDPQLRAALQKYGGEFGPAGRNGGGDHGDL